MKLGLIGTGKMGSALLRGALRSDSLQPNDVILYDHKTEHMDDLLRDFPDMQAATSIEELSSKSDVIFIAVKPHGILQVMNRISEAFRPLIGDADEEAPLILSIAAGVKLKQLQDVSFEGARIIRVMPNTPALIGSGTSVFCTGANATTDDANLVVSLLEKSGSIIEIKESQMDAVSAISGSGPAYMYVILDALSEAGVAEGLPRPLALDLAVRTMIGSAELVLQSNRHPMSLRDDVTSPGGTTIEALNMLDRHGLRHALIEAVKAAVDKSAKLDL